MQKGKGRRERERKGPYDSTRVNLSCRVLEPVNHRRADVVVVSRMPNTPL